MKKPMFRASAQHDLSDDFDIPEVIVEPSDIVLVDGKCLAVEFLER